MVRLNLSHNIDDFLKNKPVVTELVNPANITIVSANICCFIVFQCLFFYFVASKQFENLIYDKSDIMKPFLEKSPVIGKLICSSMKKTANKLEKKLLNVRWKYIGDSQIKYEFEDHDYRLSNIYESSTLKNKILKTNSIDIPGLQEKSIVKSGKHYFQSVHISTALNEENIETLKKTAFPYVSTCGIICIVCLIISLSNKIWTKSHSIALALVATCFTTEFVIYITLFKTHQIVGDWYIIKQGHALTK